MNRSVELYEIIQLIRPAHRRLARVVEAKLAGTGVTVAMRAVMEVLDRSGPMPVPEIGRTLFLARQQIQLVVNSLETAELVVRQSNPAHRRSPLFSLTDTGHQLFSQIRTRENVDIDAVSGLFSDKDLSATQKVLCALLDHFAEFEDDPDCPKALE